MGKKAPDRLAPRLSGTGPTLEEMREARRQNRNTRPALTKHTPIVHQRSNGNSSVKKPVKRKA